MVMDLSAPTPSSRRRRARGSEWLVVSVAALLVSVVLALVHVPYAVQAPGPIRNTLGSSATGNDMIQVAGHATYPTTGALYFTTVSLSGSPGKGVSIWEWLRAKASGDAVVPLDRVFEPNVTKREVEERSAAAMAGSQQGAIAVAARAVGMKVTTRVRVAGVAKGRPAQGRMRVGDQLVSVNERAVSSVRQAVSLISSVPVGSSVRLVVMRGGKRVSVSVPTVALDKRALIGVTLSTHLSLPMKVEVDPGSVGGPSAGMMFALGIYDRITPGALTGGKQIAGTGTLDDDGTVGPIGGIEQKMRGASEGGAPYFLAPQANCKDVRGKVPDGLQVVRVATFTEAMDAVKAIAGNRGGALPSCG